MALYVGDTRYKVMVGNQKHDFVVPLPYDAEVEWLQSDGNAYIDTGIKVAGNLSANVHLVDFFDSESVGRSAFGGQIYIEEGEWDSDIRQFGFGINQDGKAVFYYDDSNIVLDDYSTYPQSARVVIENGVISIGSEQYTYTTASFTTLRNVILFGWNNGLIFNTPCKMGTCYLSDGTTTLDLIPVRKDGVGYMYDKISGRLFGREETGNFIIGPDKNLPYDAEVEYLESTDETKIVTDITFGSTTEFTATFSLGVPSKRVFLCGIYSTNKDGYWCVGSTGYVEEKYNTNSSVLAGDNNRHEFVRARGVKKVDGTTINKNTEADNGWFSFPNNPLTFFAPMSTANPSGGIKLHSAQVRNNSVLVHDLVPVRVGQTGYLYDKVSRQLFGNAGTGDFIIGNDVTT